LKDARLQNFTIIFLSILIEAFPFILVGTLVSGLVEVFITNLTVKSF